MIVVDTDVTSYFWLQMTVDRSAAARAARERGADRVVPYLWRSEFRSVLRGYMTRDLMTLAEAKRFHNQALDDLRGHEYEIPAAPVLELVAETGPSPDLTIGIMSSRVARQIRQAGGKPHFVRLRFSGASVADRPLKKPLTTGANWQSYHVRL